jgi:hypothetical protein
VAELVYAPVLGTGSRKGLRVRVSSWALFENFKQKKGGQSHSDRLKLLKSLRRQAAWAML